MFLCAGLVSPIGGIAGEDTALPLVISMSCTELAVAACFIAVRRYVARHPQLEKAFHTTPTPVLAEA